MLQRNFPEFESAFSVCAFAYPVLGQAGCLGQQAQAPYHSISAEADPVMRMIAVVEVSGSQSRNRCQVPVAFLEMSGSAFAFSTFGRRLRSLTLRLYRRPLQQVHYGGR